MAGGMGGSPLAGGDGVGRANGFNVMNGGNGMNGGVNGSQGMNGGNGNQARHISQESVSVDAGGWHGQNGRHSPDAFASLSARDLR